MKKLATIVLFAGVTLGVATPALAHNRHNDDHEHTTTTVVSTTIPVEPSTTMAPEPTTTSPTVPPSTVEPPLTVPVPVDPCAVTTDRHPLTLDGPATVCGVIPAPTIPLPPTVTPDPDESCVTGPGYILCSPTTTVVPVDSTVPVVTQVLPETGRDVTGLVYIGLVGFVVGFLLVFLSKNL